MTFIYKGFYVCWDKIRQWCLLYLLKDDQLREVKKWYKYNPNSEARYRYDLDENSLVFDLGGYKGDWAHEIFRLFSCKVFVFEPVNVFFEIIKERFKSDSRIYVFDFGLAGSTKTEKISMMDDGSSIYRNGSKTVDIRLVSVKDFLHGHNIKDVDLLKINIEGAEYELLEKLIEFGLINRFKYLQIQFHRFVGDAEQRRNSIQAKLLKTHSLMYNYPFVWESWQKKVPR